MTCPWQVILLSIPIHLLIVLLILSADDFFPPVSVLEVPLDGLLYSVFELCLRQPAEFVVDLGRVDGISYVMALPVCYICDAALRLALISGFFRFALCDKIWAYINSGLLALIMTGVVE